MQTQAQMWGNSLALRIPKSLAKAAGIEPGTPIKLSIVKGKLVVERVTTREYTLEELLARTPRNKGKGHGETDTGVPVGREVW